MKKHIINITMFMVFCWIPSAHSLMEQKTGPQPEEYDSPYYADGIIALLRHESRVYSMWVNGNNNFYYNSTPKQINELIKLYSQSHLRDHVLIIKEGAAMASPFEQNEISYNVQLHVLEGIALHHYRMQEDPKTFEPTLTIHIPKDAGDEFYSMINIPQNIIINSEVESCPLKSELTQPARQTWYAHIQFDDNTPAVDFESSLKTNITYWANDQELGFDLGEVNYKGYFIAAFSDQEMDALQSGDSWLTLTVGNFLTQSLIGHPRLDINALNLSKENAVVFTIAKPDLYYGRILFEDGTPPKVPEGFWQGAEITVSFPYAGQPTIDREGYFQVFFTDEQFEALKSKKERKNIYIPIFEEKNTGRAEHIYPLSNLTKDKAAVEPIKISKPGP